MKKEDINILKIKKKLIYLKKNEVKTILLKSIIQNNKIPNIYKSYAQSVIGTRKLSCLRFKHICLKNNKSSSVYNSVYLSKYGFKNLLLNATAQNIKLNSW